MLVKIFSSFNLQYSNINSIIKYENPDNDKSKGYDKFVE